VEFVDNWRIGRCRIGISTIHTVMINS
jgi:hypothetical protein